MEKLHSGTKLIFFFQYIFVFIGLFVALIAFLLQGALNLIGGGIVLLGFLLIIIVPLAGAWIWAVLTYNNWGFELRKEGLYMERGVIWKKYSTIPYERIQNIDITRGVIARILGFSTLMVQTAGYSAQPQRGFMAEGFIPGVAESEAIKVRDKLLKVVSGKKQGL